MAPGHAQRMYTHEEYPIYLEESKCDSDSET